MGSNSLNMPRSKRLKTSEKSENLKMQDKDYISSLLAQSMGNEIWTALTRILSKSANAVKIFESENSELKQTALEVNRELLALRLEQEEQSKKYLVLLDNFSKEAKVITELRNENLALKSHVEILETRKMGLGDQSLGDFRAKNEDEIFQYFDKKHLSESNEDSDKMTDGKESYNCKYCDKQFSSQRDFDFHHKNMHIGSLICTQCKKQYSSKSNLYLHTQSKHKGIAFQCNFCEYSGNQKSALKIHMKKNHTVKRLHVPVPLRATGTAKL